MVRLRLGVFVLIAVMFAGNWLLGDDKKADDKDPPKSRTLPQHFKKLGLTDKQKDTVFTIMGKYHAKLDALDKEIKELKAAQKKDVEDVLTADQKARLRELRLGESDMDKKDKDEKKDKDDKDKKKDEKKDK